MQKIIGAAYARVSEIEIFSQARAGQMKIVRETDFDPLNTSLLTAAWPARLGTRPHGAPKIADRLQEGPLTRVTSDMTRTREIRATHCKPCGTGKATTATPT